MKNLSFKSEKGQSIVLLAVGLIGLLAFVALAIDGGMVLYDRRSAQNAADAAALAGAYTLANNPWPATTNIVDPSVDPLKSMIHNVKCDAYTRAHDNHYGGDPVGITCLSEPVDDGKIVNVSYPLSDAELTKIHKVANDSNKYHYVKVVISSTVNTTFLHLIGINLVTNTVESVAHVIPPQPTVPFHGAGLVSLKPTGCGTTYLSGNLVVNLIGGGLYVNSNGDCALDGPGNSSFIYTPALTVVGNKSDSLVSCPPETTNCNLIVQPGPPNYDATNKALPYPPGINLDPPPTCSTQSVKGVTTTVDGITYNKWSPGYMDGFPNGNIYFEDGGIYCINVPNGGTSINNSQHLYNDPNGSGGVLIVFRGVSGSNPCNVTFNAGATVKLSGFKADPAYKGLLIYVDYGNWTLIGESNKPLQFNGDIDSYIKGTVYAPTCYVKLNGTGGNFYQGQMIGYELQLIGGAAINVTYVIEDNLQPLSTSYTDLSQ